MSNTAARLSSAELLEILSLSSNATAVYTSADIIIETANDAMIAFWGKDRSVIGLPLIEAVPELAGQPFVELLQQVWISGITNSGKAAQAQLMIDGRLQTSFYDYEYRAIKDQDGNVQAILHTATDVTERELNRKALLEGEKREQDLSEELAAANEELELINEELIATNEDLLGSQEVLKQLNQQLQQSQDELLFAIDAASLGTWDLDPVTNRFSGNNLLKSWFGLQSDDEIELSKATAVIEPEDRPRVQAAIDYAMKYESGGHYDIDYTILSSEDASPRIVRAKGKALFDDHRNVQRFSGILQDITEQKRDEQRKNDFISMVSHELKTPLTTLKAYIQLLHSRAVKGQDTFVSNALTKASQQVNKMNTLITGFLNVSRLESGKIHLQLQEFDMGELVHEVVEDTKLVLTTHSIQVDCCEGLFVNADRDKIGQVINNLISNAVKYSPVGTQITLVCEQTDYHLQVSISDQGIGIPSNDVDKLFDRFYRVQNKDTNNIAGFGIGLYLCAEIVQRHQGRIWVESETGKGSTFSFLLPLR